LRRILWVEENACNVELMYSCLAHEFDIAWFKTFAEGHAAFAASRFDDLVVLKSIAANDSALDFCDFLRKQPMSKNIPVIFIAERRESAEVLRAFEVGADDFMVMPFDPLELKARIRARFKRQQPLAHDLFWKADLRMSLGTQRAVLTDANGEHDLQLTPNEFKILFYLASFQDQTISRKQILEEVWGSNLHVVERTVDKHVCSLRRKLGTRSHYIASVMGIGYRFKIVPDMSLAMQASIN
jgi:two-component system, OmpR family, phosphate regulon response regulator PhoB